MNGVAAYTNTGQHGVWRPQYPLTSPCSSPLLASPHSKPASLGKSLQKKYAKRKIPQYKGFICLYCHICFNIGEGCTRDNKSGQVMQRVRFVVILTSKQVFSSYTTKPSPLYVSHIDEKLDVHGRYPPPQPLLSMCSAVV